MSSDINPEDCTEEEIILQLEGEIAALRKRYGAPNSYLNVSCLAPGRYLLTVGDNDEGHSLNGVIGAANEVADTPAWVFHDCAFTSGEGE